MDCFEYGWITRQSLQYRLERDPPQNEDSPSGFALVFVQDRESFAKGHIPLSVNIPRGREHEFERRFSKGKELVLYGEGGSPGSASMVAVTLLHRGYSRVYVYEGGLRDWRAGGGPVERGPERPRLERPLEPATPPNSGPREWRRSLDAAAQDLQ
jgi:rhodanese-related sulfurtransferase